MLPRRQQALLPWRSSRAGACDWLTGAPPRPAPPRRRCLPRSRAFVRAVMQDDYLPVTSPTFLLQNVYETDQGGPAPLLRTPPQHQHQCA
jgi:hypothetical protein